MGIDIAPSADEALSRAKVLDKGEVALLSMMGGDSAVINAARVSNGVIGNASKGQEADQKLINYLMKHRHGTPFEHSLFTFYVKCPLFVRSEWHRHRMSSFNEISGRYVEYEPEFYVPKDWRKPGSTNKQGSVPMEWPLREASLMVQVTEWSVRAYSEYQSLLDQGVAREMARMVLPSNLYTQFYYTVNARSLMNFLSLRTAEDAQWEIREYAKAIEQMFMVAMPMTYSAWFDKNGVAP